MYDVLSFDRPRARLHRGGSAGFGSAGWEAEGEPFSSAVLVMNSPSTGALVVVLKMAQVCFIVQCMRFKEEFCCFT